MSEFKIAIVGAGSFVFGPSVLAGALLEHRLGEAELALVDVDRDVLDLVASVGQRMARQAAPGARVTAHTDRAAAFDGADFVICSAAPEMRMRHKMDCDIIDTFLPGHLVTEFGGIAGISYSLRQIAFITALAADMQRRCPRAWLFTVSNPLPRVCQAAHESGVPTVGFCSVSLSVYAMLWRILRGQAIDYPFTAAREAYEVLVAGLNHLSWLLEVRDRATRADLMPTLHKKLEDGISSGNPRAETIARETGYLLATTDNHTRDFLRPAGEVGPRYDVWHGTPEERERRLAVLRDVAEGKASWDELLRQASWEKPIDLVAAMARGGTVHFDSLNLVNRGQIPNLPDGLFVETPADGSPQGPLPQTVRLPEIILPYCRRTAQVTDLIVHAGLERSRRLVEKAVELDPTILNKSAGKRAIDACLDLHADVLGPYA